MRTTHYCSCPCGCKVHFDTFSLEPSPECPRCRVYCQGCSREDRTGLSVQLVGDKMVWAPHKDWHQPLIARLSATKGEYEGILARASYPVVLPPLPRPAPRTVRRT